MVNQVIFSGTPSQANNVPALLKGAAVLVLIYGIHLCASTYFPLRWHLLLLQAGAVLIGVSMPFAKSASVRIVIDTERITWAQGIFRRRTSRLDLSRIQTLTTVQSRWQRLFGIGSIIVTSNDPAHRLRTLPGIRNAEQLRMKLDDAVTLRRARTGPAGTFNVPAQVFSSVHHV